MSNDTEENGDHECTFENWVDLNNRFTQAKWGELLDKDPVKQESWKEMHVRDLLAKAEYHMNEYALSGDAHKLVHAANYLMMAWGRDADGCGPLCDHRISGGK